jgi:hypothetical protein
MWDREQKGGITDQSLSLNAKCHHARMHKQWRLAHQEHYEIRTASADAFPRYPWTALGAFAAPESRPPSSGQEHSLLETAGVDEPVLAARSQKPQRISPPAA